MTGVSKAEHVHVRVDDFAEALEFYTEVMGFTEITREDGVVYLGCGVDANYDLAVEEGETGLDHVAVRVDDERALEEYERRLNDGGVATERTDGTEPGQEQGVRFELPSEIPFEAVLVEDNDYWRSAATPYGRPSGAPLDLHHISLMPVDLERDLRFLEEMLDFDLSDVGILDGEWSLGFSRYGDLHHDFSHIPGDGDDQLHHVAWQMSDADHLIHLVDRIADYGYDLEVPISRHTIGNNVATYFRGPSDVRFELETGMSTCNANTETNFVELDERSHSWQTWGADVDMPESHWDGI